MLKKLSPITLRYFISFFSRFILYSDQQKYIYRGRRDIPEFESFVNSLTTLKDGQVNACSYIVFYILTTAINNLPVINSFYLVLMI